MKVTHDVYSGLKKCPFCGLPGAHNGPADALAYEVICSFCGGQGPRITLGGEDNRDEKECLRLSKEGWNRREES